jgi:hypothetical protein
LVGLSQAHAANESTGLCSQRRVPRCLGRTLSHGRVFRRGGEFRAGPIIGSLIFAIVRHVLADVSGGSIGDSIIESIDSFGTLVG